MESNALVGKRVMIAEDEPAIAMEHGRSMCGSSETAARLSLTTTTTWSR